MITETRQELDANPAPARPRRTRTLTVALAAVLLVGVIGARTWWHNRGVDVRSGTTLVTAEGMAATYGIDVKLVAVSAGGGLIDFRYQVVDPDRANPIIHDSALLPKLVNEETGATLVLTKLPHHQGVDLQLGGTYFFLFANASNALEPGSSVTLIIGDARMEHLVVQS